MPGLNELFQAAAERGADYVAAHPGDSFLFEILSATETFPPFIECTRPLNAEAGELAGVLDGGNRFSRDDYAAAFRALLREAEDRGFTREDSPHRLTLRQEKTFPVLRPLQFKL